MVDLSKMIADYFDAIGLVLVFSFVLFDLWHPKIDALITEPIPDAAKQDNVRKHAEKLQRGFWIKSFPLSLIYVGLFYLMLPQVIEVINTSRLNFWQFDILRTAFILVTCFLIYFGGWSIYLGGKLLGRLRKCRKRLNK
jgi:hypothetical protein